MMKYATNQKLPIYNKDSVVSHSMLDSSVLMTEGNSFDREELMRHKLAKKNFGINKKGEVKIQMNYHNKAILNTKKISNKFMMYKRPENGINNKSMNYEGLSYIDPQYKLHNASMDRSMFRKGSYQIDKKRQAKVVTTQSKKPKPKRSATPSLGVSQQYVGQYPVGVVKRKPGVKKA